MYVVVSKWSLNPEKEEAFKQTGKAMRQEIRSWPGVNLVHSFQSDSGGIVAIVGYNSEEEYHRLIDGTDSHFAKAAAKHNIESYGTWEWSERGNTESD